MRQGLMASERRTGAQTLLAAAVAALAVSVFNYFWPDNGIHGSAGALLVIISTLLMAISAAALLLADGVSRSTRGMLVVLILLDIIGTSLAAYMLEADWLIGAMAAALIGWIVHLLSNRTAGGAAIRGAA